MTKSRRLSILLAGALITVASAAGCGGGPNNSLDTIPGDVGADSLDSGIPVDSIDTVVASNTTQAGLPVKVDCIGSGWEPGLARILVWDPRKATIDFGQDAEPQEGDNPEIPKLDPETMELPEGVALEDGRLTFTVTGSFNVTCYAPDTKMIDLGPERISVDPGMAVEIETEATPTLLKAGAWVQVKCTARDRWNNPITSGFFPAVTPQNGVKTSGLDVQFIAIGTFTIACGIENTTILDSTPVQVTVEPNNARKIYTMLQPQSMLAGEKSRVDCEVRDFYENKVSSIGLSISHPPALELKGKELYTEQAGIYTVKCVPQTEDWDLFELFPVALTVSPAAPENIELKVVPNKPVYGTNQKIQVTMTATDRFGNIIPKANFSPVTILPMDYESMDGEGNIVVVESPGDGIKMLNGDTSGEFLLKKEGRYLLTFRLVQNQSLFKDLEIRVDGSGPMLSIIYPPRGATIDGKPSVAVVASIDDALSGITKLVVNGKEETPSKFIRNGTLTYQLPKIHQGLNTVEINIENSMGKKASETRGFFFSTKYYDVDLTDLEGSMVPGAIKAYLGRTFFDDGNRNPPPDDVATLMEQIVGGLKLQNLIPNPVASAGPYKVWIRKIEYDKPSVSLSPETDYLALGIDIRNFHLEVEAEGKCQFIIDWCPDVTGHVYADAFEVDTELHIKMDENAVFTSTMKFANFNIAGLDIDLEGFIGDLLDWLIDSIVDVFADAIEKAIKGQLESMLNDVIVDLLDQFKIETSLEIPSILGSKPVEVSLMTMPSKFKLDHPGMWLDMDAVIYSQKGVAHDNLGSIGRANCLKVNTDPFVIPEDAQVGFAAYDDVLNQILYAVWNAGTLNLSIGSDILGGLEIPVVVLKKVDLDFYSPPVITGCNPEYVFDPETFEGDCTVAPEQVMQLQLGDAYARIEGDVFGMPMYMEVFVQAIGLVDLAAGEDEAGNSTIKIRLLNVPKIMLDVISVDPEFLATNGWTKDQFYNDIILPMIGPLLEQLPTCEQLLDFPIPVIDLNSLVSDIPTGTNVKFFVEQFFRQNGFTAVQGHLE